MKLGTFLAVTVVAFLLSASWTFRGADWESLLGVSDPRPSMAGPLCDVRAGSEFVRFYTGRYSDGPEHWAGWYVKATQVVFHCRQGRPRVEMVGGLVHIYHRQDLELLGWEEMALDAVFGQWLWLFLLPALVGGLYALAAHLLTATRQSRRQIFSRAFR